MKHERAKILAIAALFLCLAGTLPGCRSKESRIAQHLEQAETYTGEGKLREATLELRSALQLDPASAEVNWRLAQLMRKQAAPRTSCSSTARPRASTRPAATRS